MKMTLEEALSLFDDCEKSNTTGEISDKLSLKALEIGESVAYTRNLAYRVIAQERVREDRMGPSFVSSP